MPSQTQNRKDLLQAYRLMTHRTALALIAGEPDSANQPLRRRNMATIFGVLVGVIACGVFAVLGLIFHGGPINGLTKAGTLVVDKDTATSYVPCGGKLCPALNYASALLALDSAQPDRVEVAQSALANYQIGPTVGIPGLPQDLPTSKDLVKGPWSVCMDTQGTSTLVGGASVGGTALTSSNAALVQAQGQDWVLYNGSRFQISNTTMSKLWPSATPQAVSPAWLNTLPQNPAGFAAPAIPGANQPLAGPGGPTKGGQVYQVSSAGQNTQYYVLEADQKLHSVTELQALLLENQPGAPGQQPLNAGQANNLGASVPDAGLPQTKPSLPGLTGAICVSYSSGSAHSIITGATVPANAAPTGNGGPATVNRVWLPQGHGALIGVATSAGQTSANSWFLLVGATRYGLAGPGVAGVLGYTLKSDQTVLPASLVGVLPEGKPLDPNMAVKPTSG